MPYPIFSLNIVVMKVIDQGFTQVKIAHTIDRLITVKLCLLRMKSNEVFIKDRTAIIVWLGCQFLATSSADINRISTLFLIFSSVLPKTELFISLKKIYFKVVSRLFSLYAQLRV